MQQSNGGVAKGDDGTGTTRPADEEVLPVVASSAEAAAAMVIDGSSSDTHSSKANEEGRRRDAGNGSAGAGAGAIEDISASTAAAPYSSNAYRDMLDAKDLQNRPLPIPVTSAPSRTAEAGGGAAEGERATDPSAYHEQPLRPGGPPLFQEGGDSGSPFLAAEEDAPPPPSVAPVEAVPITSIYQQVASAELVLDAPPRTPTSSPKPPASQQGPANDSNNNNGSSSTHESEEAKIERMRLQRQRFKVCKLVLLLCILIVVITVPLVIRSQRLSSSSTAPSSGGGSAAPCFPSYEELESAVDDYLAGGTRRDKATANWGNPIGIWCVSELPAGSGMDGLFSAARNPNAANFNEPLYYWDVSNVVSMVEMFRNATQFSQPLDGWNVGRVERMTGMFLGASRFRQDLCPWAVQLSQFALVHDMFLDTSCDDPQDPVLQGSLTQSFCTPCG